MELQLLSSFGEESVMPEAQTFPSSPSKDAVAHRLQLIFPGSFWKPPRISHFTFMPTFTC